MYKRQGGVGFVIRHGDIHDGDDDDDTDDNDTDDDTDDDDDDDTDYDDDHKNDSYTAAGAAPGASVPCSLFLFLRYGFFVLIPSSRFLRPGSFVPGSALS